MFHRILAKKILEWIGEDAPFWDLTTEALVPRDARVDAVIRVKTPAVAACVEDVAEALKVLGIEAVAYVVDGSEIKPGTVIMALRGRARDILYVERTILNILMYTLGVATTTREFVKRVRKVNERVRIAATRKVPPGLRALAKRAVEAGGGDTHRLSLSDAILIKDNHIAVVGSVSKAIELAKKRRSFIHKIEVEVSSLEHAVEAARAGADIIMLDNMKPREVAEVIEHLKRLGLRDKVTIEVSGGITLENVEEYAALDVDVISTSILTMNPFKVDLSLDIEEVGEGEEEEGGDNWVWSDRERTC